MTFPICTLALAAIAFAAPSPDCTRLRESFAGKRSFTNADLEQLSACRAQTNGSAETEPASPAAEQVVRRSSAPSPAARPDNAEADWRARWRSVDQKARKLRREARELRQEASETPQDPKKKPTGRRTPSILVARAASLEAEARELEDEFQETARREGALPGWLRARTR